MAGIDPSSIPTYTVTELERLADELLTESFGGVPDQPPINIEYLLESQPGVHLDIHPRLQDAYGVCGAVYRRPNGEILAVIDEEIADHPNAHFYRFTVGEELAHVRLHRDVIDTVASLEEACELMTLDIYWEMDRNARRFAAATLMPPSLMCHVAARIYPGIVDRIDFGNPDVVVKAIARGLSDEFRVSPTSTDIRMKNWPVRLVDKIVQAVQERQHQLPR